MSNERTRVMVGVKELLNQGGPTTVEKNRAALEGLAFAMVTLYAATVRLPCDPEVFERGGNAILAALADWETSERNQN